MRRPIVARTFIVCLLASLSVGLLAGFTPASAQDMKQRTEHRERASSMRQSRPARMETDRRETPQRSESTRSEPRYEARTAPRRASGSTSNNTSSGVASSTPRPESLIESRPVTGNETRTESRPTFRASPSIAQPTQSNDSRAQHQQRFEVRRQEQQQRIEAQRSPQGRVIQQALMREEQERRAESRPNVRDERIHTPSRPNVRDERIAPAGRPDWRNDRNNHPQTRISRNEQQRRIEQQRRQHNQWQRDEARWRAQFDRQHHALLKQHRPSQHRYQQDYYQRWLAQQARWNSYRFDYYSDPFFYTPYNYRYNYGGRWYSTNSYGAQLLQQAIQDGYREGWYAGRADREDRWRFDYRGNYGYINGSFGYYGHYVSMSDYQYYFRQGFERGYRDGYYGRSQYGRYDNGNASILPAVLSMILVFSIL